MYPTLAFDYSVPTLFGLIPFAIDSAEGSSAASVINRWFAPTLFLLFIVSASTITIVDALARHDVDTLLMWGYLACAALLLAIPSKLHGNLTVATEA